MTHDKPLDLGNLDGDGRHISLMAVEKIEDPAQVVEIGWTLIWAIYIYTVYIYIYSVYIYMMYCVYI